MKKNLESSMLALLLFALCLFQPAGSSGMAAPSSAQELQVKNARIGLQPSSNWNLVHALAGSVVFRAAFWISADTLWPRL